MQTDVKRYYVIVRGRVQDVGYRKRVEGTAELFNLKGFPWNDVDGSVKMICEGQDDYMTRFLEDIDIKEKLPSGIFVESLEKKEISIEFPLPSRFVRLETDELGEISRKMDVGNERLKGIETNTQRIETSTQQIDASTQRIEANTGAMMETLKSIDSTMETLKRIDSKLDSLPERIAKAIK